MQNVFGQQLLPCLAHAFHARSDAAARFRNLLVGRACDALLKIHQTRYDESRMSVGVNKPGQDHLTFTVNLNDFLVILSDPEIAQSVFGLAHGNNLPADTKHSCIFDDAELDKFRTTAWSGVAGRRAQGEKLADVDQQKRGWSHSVTFQPSRSPGRCSSHLGKYRAASSAVENAGSVLSAKM